MLPVATKEGVVTPFSDALFTATSAVWGFFVLFRVLLECFFTILIGDGHNTGDFFKYM